jgi:hypothetical protein
MLDYVEKNGKSRGSALYTNMRGKKPYNTLPDMFKFKLDTGDNEDRVQETDITDGVLQSTWRVVRPIPEGDNVFENIWKTYRENENIY